MAIVEAAKISPPVSQCSYHVFLSSKNDESCVTFVDDLYSTLMQSGIHTFRNHEKHGTGRCFHLEMQKAVKQSKVSVIIFSNEYANSRQCLDELVNIVERKRKVGHAILPVFHNVDPSHVRKQNGYYAKAFLEYEKEIMAMEDSEKKEEAKTRVQQWRAALRDVANLGGMVLKNGQEFELIQDTVDKTWIKLSRTVFNVAPHLVGIYSRVKKISLWLQDKLSDLSISVIYGTGGIGKTTIAEILYHLYHERFEVSSFLANINEFTSGSSGIVQLQKHILSDILKGENVEVNDSHQGTINIKEALSGKTFLLVLDDLDHVDQLNALLGSRDGFSAGSKVIITTRNERLLNPQDNCFFYKAKKLDYNESMKLFSLHAFQHEHPMIGYMDLSKQLVEQCQGIPLALQVLGSSLLGTTRDTWVVTLEKLGGISDCQIPKVLKIGYDHLHDDLEKNLFLDIACFFVGKHKDDVVRILDECDFYASAGIPVLVEKCLLTANQQNKLVMHQLIKEMAKEVIRQESLFQLGKYTRVWDSEDALNILREKLGTDSIEGLSLDLHESQNGSNGLHFEDYQNNLMQNLKDSPPKKLRFGLLSRLPFNSSSGASVSMLNVEGLNADAFSGMHNLRLLQLKSVNLFGSYEGFPKKLKWLCWHNFRSRSIPQDFPISHLSILEMHNSNLQRIWEGTKILASLKGLDLSHSHSLTRTPDFSCLPSLKRLILEDCVNLVKIHESIGQLPRLAFLNLRGCKNLRKLPRKIERLKSLTNLNLSGCLNLDFSVSTNKDSGLSSVFLCRITKSEHSMIEFFPRTLVSLDLSACNVTENAIPSDLSFLHYLRHLNLSENPIVSLPESIKTLSSLQSLELIKCTGLELLPELPWSLQTLDARNCRLLKRITNLPNYLRSLDLHLKDCEELVEVKAVFKLIPISSIEKILKLWGGIDLKGLEVIQMEFFNNLTKTIKKGPLHGLYEFGIFSTFFPGEKVAEGFEKKSTGHPIWLTVPQIPELGRHKLDICVVYTHNKNSCHPCEKHCIEVRNETKGITWIYSPVVFAYSGSSANILWLSRWTFCNHQLEGGDQVIVSLDMSCDIKEFGVDLFGETQDEDASIVQIDEVMQLERPSSHPVSGMDLSDYQLNTNVYLLIHHS